MPHPSAAVACLQNTRALPFLHIVSNPEAPAQQVYLGWGGKKLKFREERYEEDHLTTQAQAAFLVGSAPPAIKLVL